MPMRQTVLAQGRVVYRAAASLPSQSELKFTDVASTTTLAAGSVAFTSAGLLNGLVPNSTATGRIGRRVNMKSLYLRLTFQLATTSTGGAPLRVLVIYDKQSNGAAPTATDVLTASTFVSPNNISNRDRFVTLCDQITQPVSTGGTSQVALNIYKKLNMAIQFNAGTAGTIADITSGGVYLFLAQGGSILTANPSVEWYARIRYSDV